MVIKLIERLEMIDSWDWEIWEDDEIGKRGNEPTAKDAATAAIRFLDSLDLQSDPTVLSDGEMAQLTEWKRHG